MKPITTTLLFPKHILLLAVASMLSYGSFAQVGNGFEGPTGVGLNGSSSCWFQDFDLSAHTLANFSAPCGTVVVQESTSGATIGFTNALANTTNGADGFSDGDSFGVITAAAMSSDLGAGPTEGSQGFYMEDTDGLVVMIFDAVDLDGTSNPMVSLNYYLSSTGWETADLLHIYVEVTGCGAAGTFDLLDGATPVNVDGDDIDNGVVAEGSWNTASLSLTSYIGCNVELTIEFSANSSAEELGLDNIQFTQGIVLPVELGNFTASLQKEGVVLDWETQNEINNEGFEVQHSIDGKNWESISFVEGNGSSFIAHNYSFLHEKPVVGNNFYRLKQMDYNGVVDYSPVRVALWDGVGPIIKELKAQPNPATDWINVDIPENLVDARQLSFGIYNQMGQLIRQINRDVNDTQLGFDISDLASGLYYLQVFENGQRHTARFVVQ